MRRGKGPNVPGLLTQEHLIEQYDIVYTAGLFEGSHGGPRGFCVKGRKHLQRWTWPSARNGHLSTPEAAAQGTLGNRLPD